jgi:O-antigen ligase
MRALLIILVVFTTLSTVFNFDPGPAPGVKIKNAILYLLVLSLAFRLTLDRNFRVQMPVMLTMFGVLASYAIISYVAIVLAIDYSNYNALRNGFSLKNSLIDPMLFFLVFFYGLRSNEDALLLLKILLMGWALSHLFAVLDALGLVQIGDIERRSDGRVEGAIGESNQYGAFTAFTLPALISLVFITRGFWRVLWLALAAFTAVTLVMTVSRGAFVATVVAALGGLWLFRRHVPFGRLAMWGATAVLVIAVIVTSVIALGFGDLLYQRVVGGMSGDIEGISSGRTAIWATALEAMFETPITLITGFGWMAYNSMPFRFAAHNHYLANWFNLGLIGLSISVLLFVIPIRMARRALTSATPEARAALMGFIAAAIAVATAVFFVELYLPWQYFWAYAGIAMRLAVNAVEGPVVQPIVVPVKSREPPPAAPRDPHGWTAAR